MSTDRPPLRVVGDDERVGPKPGRIDAVLEDLSAAHGYVVEARAEYAETELFDERLDVLLVRAEDALAKVLHELRRD